MKEQVGLDTMESILEGLEDTPPVKDIEMSHRYSEEDADITIISSDGIGFKVHSFLLLRASSVFKTMINMAQSETQRDPIRLTDKFVEYNLVVESTLDIIYNREIPSFDHANIYHYVIEFARKWDIPFVLKTISKEILVHTHSSKLEKNIMKHFRLALDLGDFDLITAIIRSSKGKSWSAAGSGGTDVSDGLFFLAKTLIMDSPTRDGITREWIKGAQAFDLGGWPYSSFAAMPSPFVWAMLRAQKIVDLSPKPHSSKAFPDELGKVLGQMYPKKSAIPGGETSSA